MTYVTNRDVTNDLAAKHVDLICANRYFGWYTDGGQHYAPPFMWSAASYYLPAPTDHIADILTANLRRWRAAFPNKPLLVSEYGAGSYPGLHALPGSGAPSEFSAELREEILKATWVAFDELRKDGELQGEQMHALHDFKQRGGTYHDVGGMNFKGLYARDRSPKDHARVALSERYGRIARGEDEGRCS